MKHRILTIALAVLVLNFSVGAHEIIKFHMSSSSQYYPGTERDVEVYIPDAYNGEQPACLYVGLDGILCNAPHVMDSLINAGKMPVTIGVFVQPGVIKDKDGNVIRYNRSNEFDMPTETFAKFLERELLPQVEKLTTAKGYKIKLSKKGADGMIFGLSSGGIAAFTAAWHHPHRFSRVFCGVGTFVAMRGGNDLQAIVRKSEPRPLRIFLQDGTNDVWNPLFGHWYEGNQMLATALDFAGYDARYDWSDCYHGVKRANEIFPEVMEWMWEGWPEAPKCGKTQNNLLDTMLVDQRRWAIADVNGKYHKLSHPDTIQAIYPDGKLMARSHPGTNCLWQYTIDETGNEHNGQPFYWLHNYDNSLLIVSAMEFDGAGNLWVVTNAGIQICDQNGRVRGIIPLPQGVDAKDVVKIGIGDDVIWLLDDMGSEYSCILHVTPPTPGVAPKSQGQG
jgi:enterochelin esterase-like enzyme